MFLSNISLYEHKWYHYLLMLAVVFTIYVVLTVGVVIAISVHVGENVYSVFLNDPSQVNVYVALFLLMSFHIAVVLSFLFLFKIIHKGNVLCLVSGGCRIRWYRILFGFALYFIALMVVHVISILQNPDNYIFVFQVEKFIPYFLFLLLLLPIQVLAEEFLIRSYFMQGLSLKSTTSVVPIFFSALTFAMMHNNNQTFEAMWMFYLYNFISGIVFAVIAVLDDGIELNIGVHIANNLFAFMLFDMGLNSPSIFRYNGVEKSGFSDSLSLVIILCLLLLVFSRKYKWNWRSLNEKIVPQDIE